MKLLIVITTLIFAPTMYALADTHPANLKKGLNKGLNVTYENITYNALQAEKSCHTLFKSIPSETTIKQKKLFMDLVKNWKMVESEYILGEFNSDMIDTPRYLDIFHYNTNQPIQPQLAKYLSKKTSAENALFKNAFKSINGLEYILYSHPKSDLQQSYAKEITRSICENLNSIHTAYKTDKKNFLDNKEKFEGILLNTLIDSSYKLKEWRIGDVIGLSKKYKDNFDVNRAEYANSKLSIFAIHNILLNHKAIMGKNGSLSPLLKNSKNKAILETINKRIEDALIITEKLQKDGFNTNNKKELNQLYQNTSALQKAYYEKLLGTLNITSKILEADGD